MGSFKNSENIQKKESESDRSVSNSQFSLVTLNELAMKAIESIVLFRVFSKAVNQKTSLQA